MNEIPFPVTSEEGPVPPDGVVPFLIVQLKLPAPFLKLHMFPASKLQSTKRMIFQKLNF